MTDIGQQDTARLDTVEEVCLLGQPPLRRYLSFVADWAVTEAPLDRVRCADEWRRANDYYHDLEDREGGIADRPEVRPLDPALTPRVAAIQRDARYRCTFDSMPTTFGMVELDKLVVWQQRVTQDFVDDLKIRLDPAPSPEALFDFCLPPQHPEAPVAIEQIGAHRYVFSSQSTDFRFQGAALLKPHQVREHETYGPLAGAVGLLVGFGSNLLNVIRDENRLMLHNGYHRAYAMRALGITHAPCVIQSVTRLDELAVVAKREVMEDPGFYFAARRPPLLKDFFDPNIRKVWRMRRTKKMIEVNFEVKEFTVGAS